MAEKKEKAIGDSQRRNAFLGKGKEKNRVGMMVLKNTFHLP